MKLPKFVWTGGCVLLLLVACQATSPPQTTASEEKEETQEIPLVEEENIQEDSLTVSHYICYTNDSGTTGRIWISFTEEEKALEIRYEGQISSLKLEYEREVIHEDGLVPSIDTYYQELYEGKVNGQYKLTHSGNWDYVVYTRGRDGKEFTFTIDHEANPYGSTPCF
ncbi:MAG: hypothetical protein AAFR66_16135 [Bacteroidota bacterium]